MRDDPTRPPHGARITMTGSPAGLFGELFVDSEMAALFDDRATLQGMLDFEAALAGAAPSIVFLRPGGFLENWAVMLPVAQQAAVLPSVKVPLDVRSDAVSALDVGRTAAELLFDPRPGTRVVNLAGPAEYSALDAAEILSRLLGKA
eukprot:gene47166-63188_t